MNKRRSPAQDIFRPCQDGNTRILILSASAHKDSVLIIHSRISHFNSYFLKKTRPLAETVFFIYSSDHSAPEADCLIHISVQVIAYLDSAIRICFGVAGMYDHAFSYVHGNMAVAVIIDQIARL